MFSMILKSKPFYIFGFCLSCMTSGYFYFYIHIHIYIYTWNPWESYIKFCKKAVEIINSSWTCENAEAVSHTVSAKFITLSNLVRPKIFDFDAVPNIAVDNFL